MKLELEVLASTNIKRKKPWPRISWLGEEKESLLLLDQHRVSVLYLPSGKTIRKIPKLSPLLPDVLAFSTSSNGHFLVYLLKYGDIALWHKDSDMLRVIPGLSDIVPVDEVANSVHSSVCLSDDCNTVMVALDHSRFYVWEKDPRQNVFTMREEDLQGVWCAAVAPDNVPLPPPGQSEAVSHMVISKNAVLGKVCHCSVVWTARANMSVTTLLVYLGQDHLYTASPSSLRNEWSNIQYPIKSINPSCEPMGLPGSYVVQNSPDGQVLAIGVNQRSPKLTSLLYVSPMTETVVVADLKNCGTDPTKHLEGREFWLSDLAWTTDSLLLVCMTCQGGMGVACRLGDPLPIQSSGCSLDMGPSYYLPFHLRVSVRYGSSQPTLPMEIDGDFTLQRFSLVTNPRLPMIVCSDGYGVTVLSLPPELSCMTLVRGLVLESSKHMEHLLQQGNLNLTLADAYKMPSSKGKDRSIGKHPQYKFEKPASDLLSSAVSEESLDASRDFLKDFHSGKINFGDSEALPATMDSTFGDLPERAALIKHFQKAQRSLFTAWGLLVSHSDQWSRDLETLTKHTLKNLIKLFSIILDCSGVEQILSELTPVFHSNSVENVRVFKLVSLYKALLNLLQFDSMKHKMLSAVLKFTHGTLELILLSKWLKRHETRVKTFIGCLAILKFAETTLNKIYVWVPKGTGMANSSAYEPGHLLEKEYAFFQSQGSRSNVKSEIRLEDSSTLPSRRLCVTWKLLYKHMLQYQQKLNQRPGTSDEEWRQMTNIMSAVQQKLNDLDVELAPQHQRISTGDKLSLNGLYTEALDAWKEQLQHFSPGWDSKKVSSLCHAQLYTYLLRGDLRQALDLVDHLLLQSTVSQSGQQVQVQLQGQRLSLMTLVTSTLKRQSPSDQESDLVPCIRNKAVRHLVQSLARFMAAYFTNQTLFVFPRHNPRPLPPVHIAKPVVNTRMLPVYHRDVTDCVKRHALGPLWNTGRTVEYLLLSGLVQEGAWFADHMGDWKTAFVLSVACQQHAKVAPHLYSSPKLSRQLPEHLLPKVLLERALSGLLGGQDRGELFVIDERTDLSQLTQTLESVVTAGLMANVNVAPWLLSSLIQQLKETVAKLHPLVPGDFYLPAPPVYCPQPTHTSQDIPHSREAELEWSVRFTASSLTQLILCVLNASHLSLPLLRWYIKDLAVIQQRAAQFKATVEGPCEELPALLKQHQSMSSPILSVISEQSVLPCMAAFRDLCAVQWMLHTRDKLSTLLRQREKFLSNLSYQDYMKSSWAGEDEWLRECFTCLQWTVSLLPFSRFLPQSGSLYKVLLSLLIELPPSEDTADILAENLHEWESVDAEVQEKLSVLLKQWQAVIVEPEDDGKSARDEDDGLNDSKEGRKSVTFLKASPRGKTLSVYFEKQCQSVQRLLKKKTKCFGKYDEYVFYSDPRKSVDVKAGSSLKGSKDLDLYLGSRPFESKQSYMEFLDTLSDVCFSKLVEMEGESGKEDLPLLEPFSKEVKKRELQSLAFKVVHSMRQKQSLAVLSTPRNTSTENLPPASDPPKKSSPARAGGLFRSKSVTESSNVNKTSRVVRSISEGGMEAVEEHAQADLSIQQKSPSKTNLSELALKFGQSEEALYAQDMSDAISLDIDFGQKYRRLQSLLEWLTRWGNKHQPLIVGDLDCLQPAIRIQIPPQLVVLALWLVENKYNKLSERPDDRAVTTSSQEMRLIEDEHPSRESKDSSQRKPKRKSKKVDELDQMGINLSVLSENLDEEIQVKNAYADILEGDEDSESVDTLDHRSDDLNVDLLSSLSVVRSGGSPFHSQDFMDGNLSDELSLTAATVVERETHAKSSKHRQAVSSKRIHTEREYSHKEIKAGSPARQGSTPPQLPRDSPAVSPSRSRDRSRGAPEEQILRNVHSKVSSSQRSWSNEASPERRSPSPERHSPSRQRHSPSRQRYINERNSRWDENRHQGSPHRSSRHRDNGDLASQLQRVVRGELRRMMEVQHKSMLAMMGALDDPVRPESPRQHSTLRSRDLESSQWSQGTMGSEELSRAKPKLKKNNRGEKIQGVLHELKGLQGSSSENIQKQEQGRYNEADWNGEKSPQNIPKFLRVTAERDSPGIRLPQITTAMPPGNATPNTNAIINHVHMPLLRLDADRPNILNMHNIPGYNSLPPPGYFESVSHPPVYRPAVLPPEPMARYPSQHPAPGLGFPLLRLNLDSSPHLHQFNSNALGGRQFHQNSHKEAVKQKLVQDFQQQQKENFQKHSMDKFGRQFLRVDFTALDRPRPTPGSRENDRRRKRREEKLLPVTETSEDIDKENVSSPTVSSPERVSVPRQAQPQPRRVPTVQQRDTTEVREADVLHDGYAIAPGMFDGYLQYENELGDPHMNNAKFQYETAKTIEKQRRQRNMVDVSMMTREEVDADIVTGLAEGATRKAEAATSVTRDTGTDPIQEALIEYNRCIQGGFLPPDIYLGLRFGEDAPSREQPVTDPSRGYLNVVDIRASSVLRELDGPTGEELPVQPDISLKPTSLRVSAERAAREDLGEQRDVRENRRSREAVTGDALTMRLFQRSHTTDGSVTAAVFPGTDTRAQSRESVIRQLRNMDAQLRVIDNMSHTMEQDFNSTRRLLSTIESVGEALHIEHGDPSPRSTTGKVTPQEKLRTSKEETPRSTLTPVLSDKSPQRSVRSQQLSPTPHHSQASGTQLDAKVSGLSGISDIIGEMLAEGGIDLTEAGLSPEEARKLTRQVAGSRPSESGGFDSVKMSMDKLQQIAQEAGPNANRRDSERQQALRDWMTHKHHQQQQEFRKQQRTLRELERNPFTPQHEIKRDEELLNAAKQRETGRKTLLKENAEKRYKQAANLLGDLLTDEVTLPEEPPPPRSPRHSPKASPKGSPKSARFSSKTQTRLITPRGGARPKTAPKQRTWQQSTSNRRAASATFRVSNQPTSHDPDERPIRPMPRAFLEETEDFQSRREISRTRDGHAENKVEYPQRREMGKRNTPVVDSLETITEGRWRDGYSDAQTEDSRLEPDDESQPEPYRPRPYTELVRLQRPELTRRRGSLPLEPDTGSTESDEGGATTKQQHTERPDQTDKEKLYGSKHIPGTSRVKDTSPRRVKSYTERLTEMKSSKKVYKTPIVPRQNLPKKDSLSVPRRTSRRPMHKPMTYTQQLQQLSNKGASTARAGTGRQVYVRPKVGLRSHGPIHKSLTYTQQLQRLNQHAPKTTQKVPRVDSRTFSASAQRQEARSRPYADPYTMEASPDKEYYTSDRGSDRQDRFTADYDVESDLSGWEVDERVRQILYNDDDTASSFGTHGVSSREYQASEGISDYYDVIMTNDMRLSNDHSSDMPRSNKYTDSVDVGEIQHVADAASVSSGSIMSYIDWDAVDQLIGTS